MDNKIVLDDKKKIADDPNFVPLAGFEKFEEYFRIIRECFDVLLDYYNDKTNKDIEPQIIESFIKRLLYTFEVLRFKYAYHPEDKLRIDTTESGFPNFVDILGVETDLHFKDDKLLKLQTIQSLKRQILDYRFSHIADSDNLLHQFCTRKYYEMLNASSLFTCFSLGSLMQIKRQKKKFRNYIISWGCYDKVQNRPYLYILNFEQDESETRLEEGRDNYAKLIETIKRLGSRVPLLLVLAAQIDEEHRYIHPKMLKRVCLGPIYADGYSMHDKEISQLFNDTAKDQRFIFRFEHEIIFSVKSQISVKRLGALQEIFFIPRDGSEESKRKASKIYKYVLVPHSARQHMEDTLFTDHEKITFTKEGGVINGRWS